jgi:thiamine kinase-like enzyme
MDNKTIISALINFGIIEKKPKIEVISSGYINNTYKITIDDNSMYILQMLNTNVFEKVDNISFNLNLLAKYKINIGVEFIKTTLDKLFHKDSNNNIWRLMVYREGSFTYNSTTDEHIAKECGRILSSFFYKTKNLDFKKFKAIIPNFHKLPFRIKEFNSALSNPKIDIKNCKNEIDFVYSFENNFKEIYEKPIFRICHNDSKLNNILFSNKNKALYLIDIDTIMPGQILYDFGDTLRTIVNPVNEEELDLTKINFNKDMFTSFLKGFTPIIKHLHKNEIKNLSLGVSLMPYLHGLRMLTDYINGNKYFKVKYKSQNLDRCRNLFKFSEIAYDNNDFMKKAILNSINSI